MDPILRGYAREQHPIIIRINNAARNDTHFSFSHVDYKRIIREMHSLNTSQASHAYVHSNMKDTIAIYYQ